MAAETNSPHLWNSNLPKIGIRPTIDGRMGGVRESLEDQTMLSMPGGELAVAARAKRVGLDRLAQTGAGVATGSMVGPGQTVSVRSTSSEQSDVLVISSETFTGPE